MSPDRLLEETPLDDSVRLALETDYERLSEGLPQPVEEYIRDNYRLDVSSVYGGLPIKNPFGKASGHSP